MHAPPFRISSMSRLGLLIAVVCFFLGASPATYGQFSEQERDRLIGAIESTQSGFDAEKLPDVDAAKAELLGKVAAVESYFQRDNDEDNSEAWLQSLSLGPLKKAIQSSAADSAVSAAVVVGMKGGHNQCMVVELQIDATIGVL